MLHVQTHPTHVVLHMLSPKGEWQCYSVSLAQSWRHLARATLVDVRVLKTYATCFALLSDEERHVAENCFAITQPGHALSLGEAQHVWFVNQREDRFASGPFRFFRRHPGSKRRFGRCHRRMHTIAERRLVAGRMVEDGEPEWRGRRRNLPNSWDDLMIGSLGTRSWKRHRQTQWKNKD